MLTALLDEITEFQAASATTWKFVGIGVGDVITECTRRATGDAVMGAIATRAYDRVNNWFDAVSVFDDLCLRNDSGLGWNNPMVRYGAWSTERGDSLWPETTRP